MTRPHTAMRKIREELRLSLGQGLSLRQVAPRPGPYTTVADHMRRARAAGPAWPLPEGLDDDALDACLFTKRAAPANPRPVPDWARVHTELRRPGVTLMLLWLEHKEDFPDGYSYTQFTVHYKP